MWIVRKPGEAGKDSPHLGRVIVDYRVPNLTEGAEVALGLGEDRKRTHEQVSAPIMVPPIQGGTQANTSVPLTPELEGELNLLKASELLCSMPDERSSRGRAQRSNPAAQEPRGQVGPAAMEEDC